MPIMVGADSIVHERDFNSIEFLSVAPLSSSEAIVCFADVWSGDTGCALVGLGKATVDANRFLSLGYNFPDGGNGPFSLAVAPLSSSEAIVCSNACSGQCGGASCRHLKASGTGLSAGPALDMSSLAANSAPMVVAPLSASTATVCYAGSYTLVSVSGTALSKGTEVADCTVSAIAPLSSSKAIACSSTMCTLLSVSGGTLSKSADLAVSAGEMILLAPLSESEAILCYYVDGSTSNLCTLLSVAAGGTLSQGVDLVVNTRTTSHLAVAGFSESEAIVCYHGDHVLPVSEHYSLSRIYTIAGPTTCSQLRASGNTLINSGEFVVDASDRMLWSLALEPTGSYEAILCYLDAVPSEGCDVCRSALVKCNELRRALPPSPPLEVVQEQATHQVTMLLTAAGAVEDYTDEVKDAIRANVASELGLGVDSVTVTVSAASVRIALAVGYSSAAAAAAGQASLVQKAGGSIMDATAFLSTNALAVSVESIDQAPTVTSLSSQPSDAPAVPTGAIVGAAAGGGAVLLLLITVVSYYKLWRRAKPNEKPQSLTKSGRGAVEPKAVATNLAEEKFSPRDVKAPPRDARARARVVQEEQEEQEEQVVLEHTSAQPPPLIEMVNTIKKELGIDGTLAQVVAKGCEELGVDTKGKPLVQQAVECCVILGGRQQSA